eukprot:2305039-Heterocapsa_arctica.AAC.1
MAPIAACVRSCMFFLYGRMIYNVSVAILAQDCTRAAFARVRNKERRCHIQPDCRPTVHHHTTSRDKLNNVLRPPHT